MGFLGNSKRKIENIPCKFDRPSEVVVSVLVYEEFVARNWVQTLSYAGGMEVLVTFGMRMRRTI